MLTLKRQIDEGCIQVYNLAVKKYRQFFHLGRPLYYLATLRLG
jgi:hypothetical protein